MPHPANNDAREIVSASVVVAGGGVIGKALALALHHRSRGTVSVAIAEPRAPRPPSSGRAYAITTASRALLMEIGVWPKLEASVQPVREMRITDSRLQDPVRQALLTFEASEEPLAHIVDEGDLLFTLSDELQAARIPAIAAGVTARHAGAAGLELQLSDGRRLRAALLAAADGAGSPCREMA
ncbi:MAG: FAD-dependent monooxygenase, partial [Beijerinckiaceae bacterium]